MYKSGINLDDENCALEAGSVVSVIKALNVLEAFTPAQSSLTLTQLSRELSMPKSTLLNIIKTLESKGYLHRDKNSKSYSLGYKVLELGYNMRSSISIIQYAIPFMENIQNKTGMTVYLTTHINGKVLYLDGVYSSRSYGKYSVIGKTLPMHCTGSGKVMLCYFSQEKVNAIIKRWGLEQVTPNTIVNEEQLMKELEQIRKQGYAVDNEEETLGSRCVAVAIRDSGGEPVGAISISGSVHSLSEESIDMHVKLVANACTALAEYSHLFPASQLQGNKNLI